MGAQRVSAKKEGEKMKVNVSAMRERLWNISGISYGLRGRAVDKSPPQGSRREEVFKVSLMFKDLINKKLCLCRQEILKGQGNKFEGER